MTHRKKRIDVVISDRPQMLIWLARFFPRGFKPYYRLFMTWSGVLESYHGDKFGLRHPAWKNEFELYEISMVERARCVNITQTLKDSISPQRRTKEEENASPLF